MHITSEPIIERADQLAHAVYDVLPSFPKSERYALVQQIQRSAISVPSNIIEGYARRGTKTYKHHAEIAYGSLMELKYQLYFACKRDFITTEQYGSIWNLIEEVAKMLWKTIKSLESKNN
jgi:four helix bundle protein